MKHNKIRSACTLLEHLVLILTLITVDYNCMFNVCKFWKIGNHFCVVEFYFHFPVSDIHERSTHIESSFQIEDAFHGIAILSLSIVMEYLSMWRIPGTGEPGGLPSMGSHRVAHNWSDLAAAAWGPLLTWVPIWLSQRTEGSYHSRNPFSAPQNMNWLMKNIRNVFFNDYTSSDVSFLRKISSA